MAYRIHKGENIVRTLLRLLVRDLAAARRELTSGGTREERVHRARQRLKRCRTVLRVLEPAFGERAIALRRKLSEAARAFGQHASMRMWLPPAPASWRSAKAVKRPASIASPRCSEARAALAHREQMPLRDVNEYFKEAIAEAATFQPIFDGQAILAQALRHARPRPQGDGDCRFHAPPPISPRPSRIPHRRPARLGPPPVLTPRQPATEGERHASVVWAAGYCPPGLSPQARPDRRQRLEPGQPAPRDRDRD